MADVETTDIEIVVDGEETTVALPTELLDRLAEPGEDHTDVVADVALMAFTGRAHALVHHAEGEADAALETAEGWLRSAFEDRFGMTYGEATGHSH
ncbi:MAG: hypothetical protein ABEI39_00700 [Halobacteriales archaeon]